MKNTSARGRPKDVAWFARSGRSHSHSRVAVFTDVQHLMLDPSLLRAPHASGAARMTDSNGSEPHRSRAARACMRNFSLASLRELCGKKTAHHRPSAASVAERPPWQL